MASKTAQALEWVRLHVLQVSREMVETAASYGFELTEKQAARIAEKITAEAYKLEAKATKAAERKAKADHREALAMLGRALKESAKQAKQAAKVAEREAAKATKAAEREAAKAAKPGSRRSRAAKAAREAANGAERSKLSDEALLALCDEDREAGAELARRYRRRNKIVDVSGITWHSFDEAPTEEKIRSVARGSFQLALLSGGESWSLTSLRGNQREYAGKYRLSRTRLLTNLAREFGAIVWYGVPFDSGGNVEIHALRMGAPDTLPRFRNGGTPYGN